MDVKFTGLKVVAHSEAILNLTEFADNLVASLKVDKKEEETEEAETVDEGYSSEDDKKPVGEIDLPKRKKIRVLKKWCKKDSFKSFVFVGECYLFQIIPR